jgi:hypothetical protein
MMRDLEDFLDANARLRRISLQATMVSMGQEVPSAVAEAMQFSPISEKTIVELDELRDRFLQLAKRPCPAVGWPGDPLAQAAECSRLAAFILNAILRTPARAADYYARAKDDFLAAGLTREAQAAEADAATCADTASGNIVGRIAAAREALKNSQAGSLAEISCHLDLGELLLQSKNQWEAQKVFKDAEARFVAIGHATPPSAAQILVNMMSAIRSTAPTDPGIIRSARDTVAVRLQFYRLYAGLEAAYSPVDTHNSGNPEEAARYSALIKTHQLLSTG